MAVALPGPQSPVRRTAMQEARFCYSHLAGRLAIELVGVFVAKKLIQTSGKEFTLTSKGERWLANCTIDVGSLRRNRRQLAPLCLDWSERKEHIGGALGAAIAESFAEEGWVKRERDSRVVHVTAAGVRALRLQFGIRWP